MTREYGYKEFDATPVRSSMGPPNQSMGPTTSNSINRGLAAMPARERSITIEERAPDGGQPQRRHREAMARNTSPKGSKPRAGAHISQWDDAGGWDQEPDEAARHRAKRLLSRPSSGFHRLGDKFAALQLWLTGERWVKRLAIVIAVLAVIFTCCFGGLWWRLGAGPINLDVATPWLAAAIEDNIGHGNTVEVGGTQIERAGRIRIAVRIRDIVVRDRDQVIVATAPKAEVKLSGTALLMGRLRAESLNLVDAELAVRITSDGQVTVSAGDTARPLHAADAGRRCRVRARDNRRTYQGRSRAEGPSGRTSREPPSRVPQSRGRHSRSGSSDCAHRPRGISEVRDWSAFAAATRSMGLRGRAANDRGQPARSRCCS